MVSPIPDEAAGMSPAAAKELRKAVLSAFMGTVIEWYDFFLYSIAAALVLPKLFFPNHSAQGGSTLAAFATFAVGFVARPFGSMLFGHLGDRLGRKTTLVWTLTLMGGSTFLIGCLPSYQTAGILAPILLVVLRIGQGLAIGGEWGGAALMAVEHGHRGQRGRHGSWAQVGVPAGLIAANGMFALMGLGGEDFLQQWGWRICFWFGLVLTVSGLIIRKRVTETPLFEKTTQTGAVARSPLKEVLRSQWRQVLLVVGIKYAENAGFYILTAYVLSYAKARAPGLDGMVQRGIVVGAIVEAFTIPLWASLSDRWGRRPVCMLGDALFAVGIFPLFAAIDSQNEALIWLAMVVLLGVVHGAMYAPEAAFFAEMFPTKLRYSGASLGYGLTTPLAGGIAPFIAAYLVNLNGGEPWLMCGYLAVICVLSFFCVVITKETHQKSISVET